MIIVRLFFRTIRVIMGPFMLLFEALTTPRGIERDADAQQQVDAETASLALYQYTTCPFCIKARKAIKGLSLHIETRDALRDPQHRADLIAGGGKAQVPCLRIDNGEQGVEWLYESDAILSYLDARFGDRLQQA